MIRVKYCLSFLLITFCVSCFGQQNVIGQGTVSFIAVDYEEIAAINDKGTSIINLQKGTISIQIPVRAFQFDKSLMQEHFNEKYMESDKFPLATYKGTIKGYQNKEGKHKVSSEGEITIHGVCKKIIAEGEIDVNEKEILLVVETRIKIKDFNVKLPKLFFISLTEEVDVVLKFNYRIF
jgi:YceI-like protein